MSAEPHYWGATEAIGGLRRRELSSVEYLEAVIARPEAIELFDEQRHVTVAFQ